MNLSDYPRIAVIGCSGSGKSTLARQIAEKTGHPVIHLDYEFWQPGWVLMPREEFLAKQQEWVQGERWIIDGFYGGSLELRYAAADLVIYLHLSRWLCLWRVLRRHGRRRPDLRPDVIEGSLFTKDALQFFWSILRKRRQHLRRISTLREKYPGVEFVRLHSRKAVRGLIK